MAVKKIKISILVTTCLLVVIFLAQYSFEHYYSWRGNKIIKITLNENIFHAETVSSQEKLERGLGQRNFLCESCAMLFEFNKSGRHSFWMKDMKIPLDILWISDGKIVHIEKNIQPSFDGTMTPTSSADFVLEINAGKADESGIEIGDAVSF